jgi:hypothetical protein
MIVENLPWNEGSIGGTLGSVLLSLTSCSVTFRLDHRDVDEASFQLPIEPHPSTFVVDFTRNSSTESQFAELSVAFDFEEATSIVEEMMHSEASPIAGDGRDDSNEQSQSHKIDDLGSCHPDQDKSTAFGGDPPSGQEQLFASMKEMEERKLLLRELHLRIEQDSLSLDRKLQMLACVSALLFGILLWAVYQYHRSNAKSEEQAQEIRESMKKTRRVLREAIEDLQPRKLEPEFDYQRIKQELFFAGQDTKTESLHQSTRKWTSASVSPSGNDSQKPQSIDAEMMDSHQSKAPCTPKKATISIHNDHEVSKKAGHSSPYTYERFAKEWMERKTIRRSNRKKRPYLRPITLPSDVTPVPVSRTASQSSSEGSQKIVGPPQLLSVVRDIATDKQLVTVKSESSTLTEDKGKPPVSNVSYVSKPSSSNNLTPGLCYTPASEDDSFIEDYWF